jgi:hypothetical protein
VQTIQIPGNATQATKVRELSSSVLGNDFLAGYSQNKKTAVVDLQVQGLPEDATVTELKKAIGAKHVISATIEQDSIKNVCTGKGRVQIRVQEGEDIEKMKLNLVSKGLSIQETSSKANKNTGFSAGQML